VRDVARLAGVSAQTVSRVINDDARVRETTRRRVREAMATLDYRINNAARALGTNQTRTLGVVVSDAALYGPAAGVTALEAAARAAGRWIATAYAHAADRDSVDAAVHHLIAQGVDGIILVAQNVGTVEQLSHAAPGVPVVALHHGQGTAAQTLGARLVVDHLAALGHRRLARLGGPEGWVEESARRAGFEDASREHGMTITDQWAGNWSAASGAKVAADVVRALAGPVPPTAVVVANDQMALGLMTSLASAGCRIPADISITGFDDNPDAAHYRPALTTVRVDIAWEARRCVAQVLGHAAADVVGAVPRLVVRASSGPPIA
jgi:DNA-binding LacI/PurR family transcriptional regulator